MIGGREINTELHAQQQIENKNKEGICNYKKLNGNGQNVCARNLIKKMPDYLARSRLVDSQV